MPYYNFAEIKANYPIEEVAERLGLKLKKQGQQLRGPCFSGDENPRKLVITPAKGMWYSFALDKGGDVIALVAAVKDISPKAAAQWIVGDTEPEKGRSERSSRERSEARGGFAPLDYLQPDHDAVLALGFDPEDAKKIGVGYAPRGVLRGTVAIPIRTDTGQLIGYIGTTDAILPKDWKW